eukprot:403373370
MEALSKKLNIYWFRKALRLHDNKGLIDSSSTCTNLLPIFILDPWFVKNEEKVGTNRMKFLIDSLIDLNKSLQKEYDSNLVILYGQPAEIFEKLAHESEKLYFELDTEPYAQDRDRKVVQICEKAGVQVHRNTGHTLLKLSDLADAGETCKNYGDFQKFMRDKKIESPLDKPKELPQLPNNYEKLLKHLKIEYSNDVPSISDLDRNEKDVTTHFIGGETKALEIMEEYIKDKRRVNSFSKPFTSPNSLKPSTTALSPYLKFGCLSIRLFHEKVKSVLRSDCTQPPVSLIGQIYWREFFYAKSYTVKNFHFMQGNPLCKQINWNKDEEIIKKWEMGQTGFPAIDAVMNQLRQEGWMHHLARHLVACFLTRGHLYQHWERGRDVFDKYLLDADYALNNANWMWLSCSAFFSQYWKVYSPVSFFQKTDKNGDFIRKYVPALKHFPSEYIYEPSKAPVAVQKRAKCIIGEDYPFPIVDYKAEQALNINKLKIIFAQSKDLNSKNNSSQKIVKKVLTSSQSNNKSKQNDDYDSESDGIKQAKDTQVDNDEDYAEKSMPKGRKTPQKKTPNMIKSQK